MKQLPLAPAFKSGRLRGGQGCGRRASGVLVRMQVNVRSSVPTCVPGAMQGLHVCAEAGSPAHSPRVAQPKMWWETGWEALGDQGERGKGAGPGP